MPRDLDRLRFLLGAVLLGLGCAAPPAAAGERAGNAATEADAHAAAPQDAASAAPAECRVPEALPPDAVVMDRVVVELPASPADDAAAEVIVLGNRGQND